MKLYQDFLFWIGALLVRQRGSDWISYSRKQNSVNAFVLISLLITAFTGFFGPIVRFVSNFEESVPEIKTPRGAWAVLFRPALADLAISEKVPNELWQAKSRLSDPDHFVQVRAGANKVFWAGTRISRDQANLVLEKKATQFVVGHINAEHRIYVNGELRQTGDGRDFLPIATHLVPGDLTHPSGIEIAVQIRQTLGSGRPLVVDSPITNGFFTIERARSLRDRWIFNTVIDPIALGTAAFLTSLAFFCLWLSVQDRNEYFLFAIYTLCHSAIQINSWGSIRSTLHRTLSYQLDTALSLLECSLAAMIGIAYARLRISVYLAVIGITGLFALVVVNSAATGSDFLYLSQFVPLYFGPACFAFAGLACLSQEAIGKRIGFPGMSKNKIQSRITRLRVFAYLILSLGLIYFINAHRIVTIDAFAYWHRPLQYLIISLMGIFLFRDYREFDVLQQKVATSRFHDPLASEQKVTSGFLMALDLKRSSYLYDVSAQLGLAKKIPTQWCELATEIIEMKGGAKISSAGDSLIAFFEGDSDEILRTAINSLSAICGLSKEFQGYSPEIHFRGGIIRASIHPIYKKVSRKMYEDYEDGPGETGFKNLMRFIETEKSLGLANRSLIVSEENLCIQIKSQIQLVKKQKLSVRDVGERELCYFDLAARPYQALEQSAA